jgi:hypothetical protein
MIRMSDKNDIVNLIKQLMKHRVADGRFEKKIPSNNVQPAKVILICYP